jgi:hypothetical protein
MLFVVAAGMSPAEAASRRSNSSKSGFIGAGGIHYRGPNEPTAPGMRVGTFKLRPAGTVQVKFYDTPPPAEPMTLPSNGAERSSSAASGFKTGTFKLKPAGTVRVKFYDTPPPAEPMPLPSKGGER